MYQWNYSCIDSCAIIQTKGVMIATNIVPIKTKLTYFSIYCDFGCYSNKICFEEVERKCILRRVKKQII